MSLYTHQYRRDYIRSVLDPQNTFFTHKNNMPMSADVTPHPAVLSDSVNNQSRISVWEWPAFPLSPHHSPPLSKHAHTHKHQHTCTCTISENDHCEILGSDCCERMWVLNTVTFTHTHTRTHSLFLSLLLLQKDERTLHSDAFRTPYEIHASYIES